MLTTEENATHKARSAVLKATKTETMHHDGRLVVNAHHSIMTAIWAMQNMAPSRGDIQCLCYHTGTIPRYINMQHD